MRDSANRLSGGPYLVGSPTDRPDLSDQRTLAYTSEFYSRRISGSLSSARQIVPFILEVTAARSVVDVGCGVGTWLSVVREQGITDVLGLDGPWVDRSALRIPDAGFMAVDLEASFPVSRRFDVAFCVEVAEHLAPDAGAKLVSSLVALAPIVAFSAAIPSQGGVHHLNEQWPEHWARQFRQHGYVPIDCLRPFAWNHQQIDFWYAQNLILFVSGGSVRDLGAAPVRFPTPEDRVLSLVHPGMYTKLLSVIESLTPDRLTLSQLLRLIPGALKRAASSRLRRVGPAPWTPENQQGGRRLEADGASEAPDLSIDGSDSFPSSGPRHG